MRTVYGTIDVTNGQQVSEYERHFYHAYAGLADNKQVRQVWEWDDARQRVRAKITYANQIIYSARDAGGRLTKAMAINLNYPAEFQAAAFGFTPPGGPGERSCEILNVMTTPHNDTTARVTYGSFISGFGYADLVAHGFDTAYSTCVRRLLRPYQRLGARVVAQTSVAGEERFFLLWKIRELVSAAAGARCGGMTHGEQVLTSA